MATEIVVQHRSSGMELLAEMARREGLDSQSAVEIARQIVELETGMETLRQSRDRFEWEKLDRQAKVAFAEAFKVFKDDAPKILKTKHVSFPSRKEGSPDTSYWHVELDKACELLIPALLKVGITHRWKSVDLPGGMTRVTCFLRHSLGYEEEGATLAGTADNSGGKNPIQGVGSTASYLERYTFLATCGIVASGNDNDGADVSGVTTGDAEGLILAINTAETAEDAMRAWGAAVNAARKFTPIDYRAMTIFTEARDERLKALKRAK
jgi:hypothetical protein